GYVPFEMANDYINSFDICFASYKKGTSGFPMKILDYLACNKPVITSAIPAITKYFHSSDTFKIVEPGNVKLLQNAITDLYQIRNQEIKTHREFVLNNYTWDHTAQNIMKVIEETLCAA
ncbi:MAG: glycosyltransferase, partial [Candidatus Marinimicrobia bacterium]|nr:glycosyltransferase [Candidatus Neomarinimicrobiota bacterium]